MKIKRTARLLVLMLAAAVATSGCSSIESASAGTENLTAGLSMGQEISCYAEDALCKDEAVVITDFGLKVTGENLKNSENTMFSPVSIVSALGMAANGAGGETLEEMEKVIGLSRDKTNDYIKAYCDILLSDEYSEGVNVANSIWLRNTESFSVKEDFLKKNREYYSADVYKADFDSNTVKDVNNWVKKETSDMIPEIIKEMDSSQLALLINAVSFEKEWMKPYEKDAIEDGVFTTEDGNKQEATMMHSTESEYLQCDGATGFIKHYRDSNYSFAALLPENGVTVEELIGNLDGETLRKTLEEPEPCDVMVTMPKFESDYELSLNDTLKSMGMKTAFTMDADFSEMGEFNGGGFCIGDVIHKTHIEVDEQGTKAAAVTGIEMKATAVFDEREVKEVVLDRPFVYLIYDEESKIPLFIGTTMSVKEK